MRSWLWSIFSKLLFRFDAESVHRVSVFMVHLGGKLPGHPLRWISGASRVPLSEPKTNVMGLEFTTRVGLAAGFDKNGEILTALPDLGFGFAEIGTVTPRPQPGNDRPRLFRDASRQAVFNRMGFNNLGAAVIAQRVALARQKLPSSFKVGINVGKNKDTPLEDAASDYAKAIQAFDGLADYVVVNVSSPNTPGLRSLQSLESLKPILGAVNQVISHWKKRPPLLLKLAPEVQGDELSAILESGADLGVQGWVLTNTLAGTREGQAGGWSGAPLRDAARARLIEARAQTRLPIISVGGIVSVEEAEERLRLGADLIQIYSGWIFKGPSFPAQIAQKTKALDRSPGL